LAVINRNIDAQSATEFFWALGVLFLVLLALTLLVRPTLPADERKVIRQEIPHEPLNLKTVVQM
jgi:hypothetical protein